jgi:osmotically-inducible protein OsmY
MSFNDRWRDDQDRFGSERSGQDRDQWRRQDREWQRGDDWRRQDEDRRLSRGRSGEDYGWGRSGMGVGSSGYRGGGQYEGMGDDERSRTGSSGAYGSGMGSGWGGYGRDEGSRGYRGEQDYGRRGGFYGSGSEWSGSGSWGSESSGYRGGSGMGEGGSRGNRGGRDWWDRTTDEVASWFGDDDAERRRRQDARHDGEHRGRGPKGYARSDDRIREDVCDRLTDDPMVDASEIEVSVSGSEVTLAGTVNRRDLRRRAEDLAEAVSGVIHVQNNLRVAQGTGGTMGMGTETSRSGSTTSSSPSGSGGSLFGSGTNSGTGGETARTESAAARAGGTGGLSGS